MYRFIFTVIIAALLPVSGLFAQTTYNASEANPSGTDGVVIADTVDDEPEPDLTPVSVPLDFEDQDIDWNNVFLGFEGAHVDVIENPHKGEDNDSDYVGRMVKDAVIYWAGAFFLVDEPFYFDDENYTISMDVWSPRSNVGINLKVEQFDGENEVDAFAVTSTSGEWETLTWEYSGANVLHDWDQITMIFDFDEGQDGDGGEDWTWFFDNLEVNVADPDAERPEGPANPEDLHPVTLPLDFEDEDYNWNFAFFGFEGGFAERVENPDQSDRNSSDWVGKMIKGAGPFWAGAFTHIDESFTIDENASAISMKVWSPREDVPVLMKVEQQDGEAEYEVVGNTTKSQKWEEMIWDMSGAGFETEWDVVTLIFDFQESGAGDGGEGSTWYFDDLEVNVEYQPTSIDESGDLTPAAFNLEQNYPNPFNPETQIRYEVPEESEVTLEVFNLMGRRIAVLASGTHQPGQYTASFDANDLASGVYIYRLQAGSFSQTKKMMFVK